MPKLSAYLERVEGLVNPGQQAGEGWLLTAEMAEFLASGVDNVVVCSPSGACPTTSRDAARWASCATASRRPTSSALTLKAARPRATSSIASSSS